VIVYHWQKHALPANMGTMSAGSVDPINAADAFMRALREQLRAERSARGLTVDELAHRSGVSARSMHRYLSGDVDIPTSATIKIAGALGLTLEVLWRRAEARAEGR
jgi:lambda repressor-like predicted transcriptional regulator